MFVDIGDNIIWLEKYKEVWMWKNILIAIN